MAEIVTDALRAALLEWAGYSSRVFEFVSPEHSGKNLMLTASRSISREPKLDLAPAIREFAKNYGVRAHHLAGKLGFEF